MINHHCDVDDHDYNAAGDDDDDVDTEYIHIYMMMMTMTTLMMMMTSAVYSMGCCHAQDDHSVQKHQTLTSDSAH